MYYNIEKVKYTLVVKRKSQYDNIKTMKGKSI